MKFYLSLILFLFLNYIAHSQNLTGRWVGTFTEQRGPSYIYEMNLEQTGNDIKGTSKYSFYKRFGIIELEGSIKNNLFECKEIKNISGNSSAWCLKFGTLKLTDIGDKYTLTGNWKSSTSCSPGIIYLEFNPNLNIDEATSENFNEPLKIKDVLLPKLEVLYNIKANELDYSNTTFLSHYLETYDKVNYKSYSSNEFERNKKMAELKNEISSSLASLKYTDIYTAKKSVKFGEYDFANKSFAFQPFAEEFLGLPEGAINEKNYFFNYAGFKQMHYRSSFIIVSNIADFKGLYLDENGAQQLLKLKTIDGKIDRSLTIKIFYSITNSVLKDYYGSQSNGIYCYVYKLEVWSDKCAKEKLITVINAKTPPPKQNEKTKIEFDKLYSTGNIGKSNYKGYPESDNFKSILSWSQYNENCEREELELHLKLLKTSADGGILMIRLYTNYNYNISPGFSFSFYNKESNIEFPLVIYEAVVDNGAALLKIKCTKQTLTQIVNSNCYSFRLQLNGYAKYSLPGGGVQRNLNAVSRNIDVADYYLGDVGRNTLFSILKQ